MKMGMENMLTARSPDIPSHRKAFGLKLGQMALGLAQHGSEIVPLFGTEIERCLDMPAWALSPMRFCCPRWRSFS